MSPLSPSPPFLPMSSHPCPASLLEVQAVDSALNRTSEAGTVNSALHHNASTRGLNQLKPSRRQGGTLASCGATGSEISRVLDDTSEGLAFLHRHGCSSAPPTPSFHISPRLTLPLSPSLTQQPLPPPPNAATESCTVPSRQPTSSSTIMIQEEEQLSRCPVALVSYLQV